LNSYAIYQRRAGRYLESLASYEASLDIARRYGYRATVGLLLGNMANLYRVTNRTALALETLRESIEITRAHGSHYALSYRLETLGHVHLELGSIAAAVAAFRESMQIREQAGYAYEKVISAQGLGEALLALGQEEEAIAVLLKNREEAREALNGLAFANTVITLGRFGHASASDLLMAADVARFLGAVEPEWSAMYVLANLAAQQESFDLAIFFGKQAVNLFQQVRGLNSGMDRQAQRDLLARGTAMYKDLADWLIAQGRLPEAQQVMAMLKEDEYFDFVQRNQSADIRKTQASMTSSESAAQARIQESGNHLFRLATRVREIEKKRDAGGLTGAERAELRTGREELRAANTAFEKLVLELRETFARLDNADRRKELERKLIEQSLAETVRSLGAGVAAIQTVTLPDQLALLLTTDKLSRAYRVKINEAELNRRVAALLNDLRQPKTDPQAAARALYAILVEPLRADLQEAGITTLMFSLDGTLRYVPMAALHDGAAYLVETYAISIFNEAARTSIGLPPASRWRVAGLGLSKEMAGFSPLHAVVDELQAIAGAKGVLPGYVHLDEQFDRNALLDAADDGLPVIHIASHFKFQPGTEADSFLLLGNGDKLTLGEFREQIRLAGVDLLTLSACETAVGGKGSEVEGLAVTAQLRGAKSVIATLWPVADNSTSRLMQNFYRLREEQRLTKAEALRQAQLALLGAKVGAGGTADVERGNVRTADGQKTLTFIPDPKAPFAHPYYWAPFVLMGNWL
jgi:CHAT domain-containing protein/tetratricopeptide (TPR) repeat protein